jgi:predicted O-methyltransferase YrrM
MSRARSLRTELLALSPSIFGKTLKLRSGTRDKLVNSVERLEELEKTHQEALERLVKLEKTHQEALERLVKLEKTHQEELERLRLKPSLSPEFVPPGHYYSPLLDIASLAPSSLSMPFDGVECWEHIELCPQEQRIYYEDLLDRFPVLPFPIQKTDCYRYFTDNEWFILSDAFTLSGIIRKEKPRRIVEIGSGFSSAVMLDTLSQTHESAALTFIEPFPDRLHSLLSSSDRASSTILMQPVQEVSLSVFDQLDAQDILFIDSSHVAKIGSDVNIILLRILPRLRRGVLVHFHDVFYPVSYPVNWIREGRAWNESIFLRAFLMQNRDFRVMAFNSFAGYSFPELFRDRLAGFLNNTGGSMWLRKEA